MPSHPWPIWVLTLALLIGLPTVNYVYWPLVAETGALPPDGDSIGIAIYGSWIVMLVLSPIILGVSWLCLWRYNPETKLWTWRSDRPMRSTIATTVSLLPVTLLLFDLATGVASGIKLAWPWFEFLPIAYKSMWLPWVLALRSAYVGQFVYEPIERYF